MTLTSEEIDGLLESCDIDGYFKALRFSEYHHLDLGDIRLTIGMQEKIVEAFNKVRAMPPSHGADGPPSPDSRERPALIGDQVDADIRRLRSLCVGSWAAESESSREMAAWYADCANRYEIIAGAYFATWRREKHELNNG